MASGAARGALVLGPLVIGAFLLGWWWVHQSIPSLDGRIALAGLREPVRVQFDRFAIPHVFAGSETDAWRAVGYLQGRDRLWQLDLYRHVASGRLSELLGAATVAIDQRFLTVGLRRAAEIEWKETPEHVRAALESYSAGVNAAMSARGRKLPLEHQLLRLVPEPWTPIDSLAIGKLFAWRLGENHRAELLRYELVEALGPRALELFPEPPEWAPVILVGGDTARGTGQRGAGGATGAGGASGVIDARHTTRPTNGDQRRATGGQRRATGDQRRATGDQRPATSAQYPPGLEWLSLDSRALSNSWVVHGSRTASGRPILANDPHLAMEMPSVWWEVHVATGSLNVMGVTIPGIPFVIIGHNNRIGWGLTNVGADVQDYFIEKLDEERQRYQVGTGWAPLLTRRHEIRIRGREQPFAFEVHQTRNGPVLNPGGWHEVEPGESTESKLVQPAALALRWDAILTGGSAAAFDALARASGWAEFVDAVRRFSAPAQNFVYADVEGNIGYAMSGVLPGRRGSDGSLPVAGWLADPGWGDSIEVGKLPAILNPSSGQIVTANNEVDRTLPYVISRDWVAPFRAQRITELLGDRRGLDLDAMRRIQTDITSRSADWILRQIELPDSVAELGTWDRRIDERPTSLLYQAFEEALWRRTFADEMSTELFDRFYRYAGNERFTGLHGVIADRHSPWFDDRTTPERRETRDDVVKSAAQDALSTLRQRFGDSSRWRWDEIHALKFSHPVGRGGRLLDWFFSRGPIPVTGDSMTVNKTTTNLRRPYATSDAASYRQILDVGAWDRSLGVNSTGQSGHPRSPHYFDQNILWRQGLYRELPFTHEAVEAATVSRLELVPTGEP
jgi:penicillin amidase